MEFNFVDFARVTGNMDGLTQEDGGDRNRDNRIAIYVIPTVPSYMDNSCYAVGMLLGLTVFYCLTMGLILLSQTFGDFLYTYPAIPAVK